MADVKAHRTCSKEQRLDLVWEARSVERRCLRLREVRKLLKHDATSAFRDTVAEET